MDEPARAREAFAAWRADLARNALDADPHFAAIAGRHLGHALPALHAFAGRVSTDLDALARETNRANQLPELRRWDDLGHRVERVSFHPGYHDIGRAIYATGLMGLYAEPGRELETLAYAYLLGQDGEAGHCCPLACTAGMIKIVQGAAGVPPEWLGRLYDPGYDTHFHASQFLTEVQGGSDVGSNALVARESGGAWTLHGEKWFCSVADAHLFLVTARPEGAPPGTGGVRAFVVPRHVDGALNAFELRRLKDKLGTRSMASAEIDFRGARAWPVGDFRRTVEIVLNTSRLFNAVIAAAFLQRAWREASAFARARTAFGSPIATFPVIRRILARLQTEAHAARASSFALAALSDRIARGQGDDVDRGAFRMLVNVNKSWTASTCPAGARDAIEVLGGNGAIEEFSALPRLLRDSIVMEAWEGGHGVLGAQLLRDSQRGLHRDMFAWIERTLPPHPRLQAAREQWEDAVARPDADWHMRDAIEALRAPVQAGVLLAEGRAQGVPIAEHLLATSERGYDARQDVDLARRVAAIVG